MKKCRKLFGMIAVLIIVFVLQGCGTENIAKEQDADTEIEVTDKQKDACATIRDDYINYVEGFLQEACYLESVKVCAEIQSTELTEIPADKKDYNNNNVRSRKIIFIYIPSQDDADTYLDFIESALRDRCLEVDSEVIFLHEDVTSEIADSNYEDYLSDEYCWKKVTIESE